MIFGEASRRTDHLPRRILQGFTIFEQVGGRNVQVSLETFRPTAYAELEYRASGTVFAVRNAFEDEEDEDEDPGQSLVTARIKEVKEEIDDRGEL